MRYLTFILIFSTFTITVAQESCELTSDITIKSDSFELASSFIDKHKKIGSIANSDSEFEIRYYYTPSLVNGGSVTIINCQDGALTANKINYWFNPKKPFDKRKINRVELTQLEPANSWDSFLDSLNKMNFYSFPTMDSIRHKMKKYMKLADGRTVEKRSMITDGANYTFQIKINSSFRTFKYHSPSAWYRAYDNVAELKEAADIIELFTSELNKKATNRH